MRQFIFLFSFLAVVITQAYAQDPLCYYYTYNAQQKVARERIATRGGATIDIFHAYDESGRETETKQVDSASGQTALLVLTTYYDRPCAYDKKMVTIFYYSAEKQDTSVQYQTLNEKGRITIDSLSHRGPVTKTVFSYNDTMLTREVCYSSGGKEMNRTEYAYNDKHQLISKTYVHWKGYSVIDYTYDKKGRLIAEKRKRLTQELSEPEDLGTIAEYTYSKTGQLISKSESGKANDTIQIPTTTTYSYDQHGRLLSMCAAYSPE